ncbi:MAG: hypothetical protein L0H53_16735 [Candidatus Nitrosocosmicus sp.]|nr:hypothetical protein [Candidatus Nitrosocosmicus sp.]MDN5868952.1 hypothetical protein [Candidatus Nitrosocosmicus sp.]
MGSITLSQQIVFAQQNDTSTTTAPATNYTKLFSENKEFQTCLDFMPDQCIPTVDILHQSPNTVVLKSQYIDAVWKAVDTIKKDGYEIDDITSYSITSMASSDNYVNLLVVMSK